MWEIELARRAGQRSTEKPLGGADMKRKTIKILGVLLAVVAVIVLPLQAVNAAVDHGNSTQAANQQNQPNQQSGTSPRMHVGGLKATEEQPTNPPNEISLVGLTAAILAGALIIVAVGRWPSRHPSATPHHAGHNAASPFPAPSH